MRITQPMTKITTLFACFIATFLAALAIGLPTSSTNLIAVVSVVGSAVTLVLCVRTFRGQTENVSAPRPWWRMTEKPGLGFLLAAFFLIQAKALLSVVDVIVPIRVFAVIFYGLVAFLFVSSSLRLTGSGKSSRSANQGASRIPTP